MADSDPTTYQDNPPRNPSPPTTGPEADGFFGADLERAEQGLKNIFDIPWHFPGEITIGTDPPLQDFGPTKVPPSGPLTPTGPEEPEPVEQRDQPDEQFVDEFLGDVFGGEPNYFNDPPGGPVFKPEPSASEAKKNDPPPPSGLPFRPDPRLPDPVVPDDFESPRSVPPS